MIGLIWRSAMARNEGGGFGKVLKGWRFLGAACFKIDTYELGVDNEHVKKIDDVP